jgi:hypothetical protein
MGSVDDLTDKGGSRKVKKGFAKATPEQVSEWGALGGKVSRRVKK